jgi:2-keto-3-deoxy-L-rhamnonate aldolase RhmA
MENPVLTKLRAGGCVGAMWVSLGSPTIAELDGAGRLRCHPVRPAAWLVDATRPLEAAIGMTKSKAVPLVRPQDDSYFAIGNALDSGAPRPDRADGGEARSRPKRIVAAAKYPPEGRRSFGGIRPAYDWKKTVPATNAAVFVAVMIETKGRLGERGGDRGGARHRHAVRRAVRFVAHHRDVPLISVLDHEAAIQSVLQAAKKAGKSCGLFTPNVTLAADRRLAGLPVRRPHLRPGPAWRRRRRRRSGASPTRPARA